MITADPSNPSFKFLSLSGGYLSLPTAVYCAGDFSIITWIQIISNFQGREIFDCSNGPNTDSIIIDPLNDRFNVYVFAGPSYQVITSKQAFVYKQWYNFAVTLSGNTMKLFINGNLDNQVTDMARPANVNRAKCYIGRSLSGYTSEMYLRSFRIYNRAVSDADVKTLTAYF